MAHCNAHFYADDCQLHSSYELNSYNVAIVMQNTDHESMRISTKHRLKLNTDKCSILHIATSHGCWTCRKTMHRSSLIVRSWWSVILSGHLVWSWTISSHSLTMLIILMLFIRLWEDCRVSARGRKIETCPSCGFLVFYYCYPAYGNSISGEDSE